MAKKDNTLLLIGGALVGAMLLMGKRSDSSDSALSETGVMGGSDDMMGGTTIPDQPQVVYNMTNYTNPVSTYSDATAEGLDTSSSTPTSQSINSTSYIGIDSGSVVNLSSKTKWNETDRFAVNPETGAIVDRTALQSISYDEFEKRSSTFGDWYLGNQSDMRKQSELNKKTNVFGDVAVIGGAVGGNMALPAVAKKTNNLFGFSQDVKGKSKISQFLTDPYSVATSQAKQAGSLAVKESPKWVKGVKAVSNFIPFLDVPIGAGLDVWLTRKDDNPIGWGNALKANTAGELAQLGVTGVGAVAGVGVGGIAGWVAGTGADIATTEAVYRQLGEQSLFGTKKSTQTSNPKANTTSKTSSNAKGSSVSTGTSGLFGSKKSSSSSSKKSSSSSSSKPKSSVTSKVTSTAKKAVSKYVSTGKKVTSAYKSTAKKVATKSFSGVKKAVSSAKKTTSKIKSTAGKVKTKIKSWFKKKK